MSRTSKESSSREVEGLVATLKAAQEGEKLVWRRPWSVIGPIRNMVTGRKYTGAWNLFLLSKANFLDPRWATRNQIMQMLGYVKEDGRFGQWKTTNGEVAPKDIFPVFDKTNPQSCPVRIVFVAQKKMTPEEQDAGTLTRRYGPSVRSFVVYNYEQINWPAGKGPGPLQLTQCDPSETTELVAKAERCLMRYIENEQVSLDIAEANDQPRYFPHFHMIQMPPKHMFDRPSSYLAILAHEVAHSTAAALGRASRPSRATTRPTDILRHDAEEELVAELTSLMFTRSYSVDFDQQMASNHLPYIQGWLSLLDGKDDRYLQSVAAKANAAFEYINKHGDGPVYELNTEDVEMVVS